MALKTRSTFHIYWGSKKGNQRGDEGRKGRIGEQRGVEGSPVLQPFFEDRGGGGRGEGQGQKMSL